MSSSSDRDTQRSHQKENFCTAEQKVFDCIFAIAREKKGKCSILLWTTSLTGATALRNKDTLTQLPNPPFFSLSTPLSVLHTSV